MLIGINGGYFPAICRVCLIISRRLFGYLMFWIDVFGLIAAIQKTNGHKQRRVTTREFWLGFSEARDREPVAILSNLSPGITWILLLSAVDIKSNPGPSWNCSLRRECITDRQRPVNCNSCRKWVHWDCTELGHDGQWDKNFVGTCCPKPRKQRKATCRQCKKTIARGTSRLVSRL